MTNASREELFSTRASAGSRTYFFDIKGAADGTRYLVISESKQVGEEREHHRVMIFEEHLKAFLEGLGAATEFFDFAAKAYSVEEIRRQHARAYKPWSSEEDNRLRACYDQGLKLPELARLFERQESAIRSRLARLGLGASPLPAKG